jgi:membrane associated rhomboid family serine protease
MMTEPANPQVETTPAIDKATAEPPKPVGLKQQRMPAPSWREYPNYPVVVATSLLAVAITIAWWSKTDVSVLLQTAAIRRGQLWRLFTSVFPHVDILHLVFNVYWLWTFGTSVEKRLGHLRTAALFTLLALGSNSLDFAFEAGGVGLSGIGYGLFGLLWILSERDERFRGTMDSRTVQIFVAWFFFCILLTAGKQYSVANVAHAAGAMFGILIAFAMAAPKQRTLLIASISTLLLFGLVGSTIARPWVNMSRSAGYEEARWGYEDLKAGKNQEAVRWLRESTIYQPKVAVLWYDLGLAYARVGDANKANSAFARAHQLEPNNPEFSQSMPK